MIPLIKEREKTLQSLDCELQDRSRNTKDKISGNDEVLALKSSIKPSISRAECEHRTS